MTTRFDWASRVLTFAFALQVGLGLSVALAYDGAWWAWHRQALARELWNVPDLPAEALPLVQQLATMLGATIASWAAAMLWLTWGPLRSGNRGAWWCILGSVALWFVVDTSLSACHGAWTNVGFNAAALLLTAVPLFLCRPSQNATHSP